MSTAIRQPMSPQAAVIWAIIISLMLNAAAVGCFHAARMDYGSPVVDPVEPRRFRLERARINPKFLEQSETPLPPSAVKVELNFEKLAAFDGPLSAPRIPAPQIQSEVPAPLALETTEMTVVDAFSALPHEAEGNFSQLTQALAQEAGTRALEETSQALRQDNLLSGGASGQVIAGGRSRELPKFEDISSLIKFRSPTTLARPEFRPLLLRLASDVLFEFDSATIRPAAIPTLKQVAELIQRAIKTKVTIEGHTDTIGDANYNQKLSERRAATVARWLETQLGLYKGKFAAEGYGESRPIVNPHGSIEQQAKNRRVEIRIEAEK